MISIADRMKLTAGRATGFNYMRIMLSFFVVCWHTVWVCYGFQEQVDIGHSLYRPLVASILPVFFALSGFLVAGSLERTPELAKFLGLRVLRIFPALVVETLLSAFILGPTFTTLSLKQYFTHRQLRHYLLNTLGIPHFALPGVFLGEPASGIVNGQLWTVPFELQCYLLLAVLAFLGIAQRRYVVFWLALTFQMLMLFTNMLGHHFHSLGFAVGGQCLVMCFLAGVVIHALRRTIPYHIAFFAITLTLMFTRLALHPIGDFFIPYLAAYVTVYLGLRNPPDRFLHGLGDLSYGVFLYGFPLQQVVSSWGAWTHHWYINLALVTPLAVAVAYISWNFVEKPTLSLKRHLDVLEPIDRFLERLKGASVASYLRLAEAYRPRREANPFLERRPDDGSI